jgi:hypothetical protein
MVGQKSKIAPNLSLGKLSQDQCSYAISYINLITQFVEQPQTLKGQGIYPEAQKGVDTFVQVEMSDFDAALVFLPLERDDPKEFKRIKMDVKFKEMTFAYVLELRGCNIEPSSVKFVK